MELLEDIPDLPSNEAAQLSFPPMNERYSIECSAGLRGEACDHSVYQQPERREYTRRFDGFGRMSSNQST